MFNSTLISGFIAGHTRAILTKRMARATSMDYAGMRIDLTSWICSYCDSINDVALNCRNCGAPETRGLRRFEGLPFKQTTFIYNPRQSDVK